MDSASEKKPGASSPRWHEHQIQSWTESSPGEVDHEITVFSEVRWHWHPKMCLKQMVVLIKPPGLGECAIYSESAVNKTLRPICTCGSVDLRSLSMSHRAKTSKSCTVIVDDSHEHGLRLLRLIWAAMCACGCARRIFLNPIDISRSLKCNLSHQIMGRANRSGLQASLSLAPRTND